MKVEQEVVWEGLTKPDLPDFLQHQVVPLLPSDLQDPGKKTTVHSL